MLIGHYGPAFIIKAIDKRVPLWGLFIAVQVPDIIWGILILLGVEKANINPSLTSNPLDLSYMPYSHGLLSCIVYSLLIVAVLLFFKVKKDVAWWISFAVFSHWLLDFLSHRPDLPVYGDTMKIGLGLWNYPTLAVIVEVGIFVVGAIWYAVAVGGFKRWAAVLFWLFVVVAVIASSVRGDAMSPSSASLVAISALCFYAVATIIIYIVEKNERRPN